jgi:hypothetical protein
VDSAFNAALTITAKTTDSVTFQTNLTDHRQRRSGRDGRVDRA